MLQEDISKVNFRTFKRFKERKRENKLTDVARCFEKKNEKETQLL